MACNRLIGVLRNSSDTPIFHVKAKEAIAIVADGMAEVVDDRSIRIKENHGIVIAKSSSSLLIGRQERAYESAAIDKNPRFFAGGLCRTEHQPRNISKFSGAKVGHQ